MFSSFITSSSSLWIYQQKYKLRLLSNTTFIILYLLRFSVADDPHQEDTASQQGGEGGPDERTGEEHKHYSLSSSFDSNISPKQLLLSPSSFTPALFLLIFLQVFFVCVNVPNQEDSGEEALQDASLQRRGAEP